jgi:hypothetical protein
MTYLLKNMYETGSELNLTDQITVPAAVWEAMAASTEKGPTFVEVGEDSGVFGRIVPGTSGDACAIPEWMNDRLEECEDEECWIALFASALPLAGTITLRARQEATLTELQDDAIATLSAVLSDSWSCLSVGSALPLTIGTFDVMEIRTEDVEAVTEASILDTDVILDLIPALDHVTPPIVAATASAASVTPVPEPTPVQSTGPAGSKSRFAKNYFTGTGRRTGDP